MGRARLPHVPTYRLRVDDQMNFVFRVTRDEIATPYEINVGDEVTIESATDRELRRTLVVLPDGTITLPLIGAVPAAGLSVDQAPRATRRSVQAVLQGARDHGDPGQGRHETGRPALHGQRSIGLRRPDAPGSRHARRDDPAAGRGLDSGPGAHARRVSLRAQRAVRSRRSRAVEVMPVLAQRAPRFVYVLGEVRQPGRYTLEQPTTVMQAIAMAGSWTVGAHITHVVVFRRVDDWRLIATMLDLRAALLGHTPCPASEIWVGDADLVIVPKSKLLRTDNFIDLVFTRGLYGVVPVNGSISYTVFRGLTQLP